MDDDEGAAVKARILASSCRQSLWQTPVASPLRLLVVRLLSEARGNESRHEGDDDDGGSDFPRARQRSHDEPRRKDSGEDGGKRFGKWHAEDKSNHGTGPCTGPGKGHTDEGRKGSPTLVAYAKGVYRKEQSLACNGYDTPSRTWDDLERAFSSGALSAR